MTIEHKGKTYTLFELYQDGAPCDICAICETNKDANGIEHYAMKDYFYGVARESEDNIKIARERLDEISGTEYYAVNLYAVVSNEEFCENYEFDTLEEAIQFVYECRLNKQYARQQLDCPDGLEMVEVSVAHAYVDIDGNEHFDEIKGLREDINY